MLLDQQTVTAFENSLERCESNPSFLERFYETFLASSPDVKAKFAHTDFAHQKQALQASFRAMLKTARDADGRPGDHLAGLAERHSSRDLKIGAAMYDHWLDSLLATVKTCDPQHTAEVAAAWEQVMMLGIRYMLLRY